MNNLAIIVSSTRPQRIGGTVSDWVADTLDSHWDVTMLDLAEINLPFIDEGAPAGSGVYTQPHTLAWKAAIDAADAVLIVTPEYNGFFPAPLKNAIDYLYAEWEGKPIAFVGYGFGGGGRATKALTQLMENLKADVVGTTGLIFNTDVTMEGRVTAGADKLAELHSLSDKLADAAASDDAAA
ncbi:MULTISPECIES: NADPH-dependent FMN reductase [unclassified Tessaracoccus]|uniref:NADPH-dependent FMN reductase n=1 Tax=unclassified Tessaracoccus TaxID=2635419 RepID=UPI001604A0B9|nr:NAD(P)H-dependent oxidoreductase [Tessaracoccus sp. MC1627]MBB1514849.1 NAD(P)H-dependent oxidoreductase [Tessaracoccus sp. MC1679]